MVDFIEVAPIPIVIQVFHFPVHYNSSVVVIVMCSYCYVELKVH